jgi:hypothetical protein
VTAETGVQVGLAAGILVAALTLAGALSGRADRRLLVLAAGLVGAFATAGWVVFAFVVDADVAVAAAGLSVCFLSALAAIALADGVARARRIEAEHGAAEARLQGVIDREAEERVDELERTLARARADSSSRLAEEERKLGEARRSELAQRERRVAAELGDTLTLVERRVEQRLTNWTADLDRMQQALNARLKEFAELQRRLMAEAHTRLEADAAQVKATSEEQQSLVQRLRADFERATEEAAAAARRDVDVHENDRRRALHEVSERLRQRERELSDRITAEESEAVRRIQAGFADIERRQTDQLGRIVDRTATRLSEAAVEQFATMVKNAREESARRLSRELDRAVAQFSHDAQSVLAERLAQVSDAGAARIDRKLTEIVGTLERRRDEFLAQFQRRITDAEAELRSQIRGIAADAEAERTVLEARVAELTRRLETALAEAEANLEGAFRAE